jgi:hypothetical protein
MPSPEPTLDLQMAISKAEVELSGEYNGHPTTIEYLAKDDGSVALTHVVQIQNDQGAWYEAFVDAHSGDLLSVTDFVTKLTCELERLKHCKSPLNPDVLDTQTESYLLRSRLLLRASRRWSTLRT